MSEPAVDQYALEERAAIAEYDGELSRTEAERLAHECARLYPGYEADQEERNKWK